MERQKRYMYCNGMTIVMIVIREKPYECLHMPIVLAFLSQPMAIQLEAVISVFSSSTTKAEN